MLSSPKMLGAAALAMACVGTGSASADPEPLAPLPRESVADNADAGAKAAADVSAGPAAPTAEDILFRGGVAREKPKH